LKEPCPTRKSDTRKRHTTAFVVPLQSFGLLAQSKEERIAKMRKAKERKAKANMAKVLGFPKVRGLQKEENTKLKDEKPSGYFFKS
jgi:hypothetical protein